MQTNQKENVFTSLKKLSIVLGGKETLEQLQFLTEVLSKYEFEKVIQAINQGITEFRFFPKPVDLINLINPPPIKEDGNAITAKIFEAIRRFGYPSPKEAQIWLGPTAWNTVLALGGWREVCWYEGDTGIQKAQMRDMALSVMNSSQIHKRLESRDNNSIAIDYDKGIF